MASVKYSKNHVWVEFSEGKAKLGITEYAQKQLKDIVFLEAENAGTDITKNSKIATIESVKTVSEVLSPVSGKIVHMNDDVEEDPNIINENAESNWIVEIELSNESELDELLTKEDYDKITN